MALQITLQPDSTRTDTYAVYVEANSHEEYIKYKEGDTSIPLSAFVGRFDVYHSATGSQGQWETASKAQLENDLGTKNVDEAIIKILKEGVDKTAKSVGKPKEGAVKNAAQSGEFSVSQGARTGGHHGGR